MFFIYFPAEKPGFSSLKRARESFYVSRSFALKLRAQKLRGESKYSNSKLPSALSHGPRAALGLESLLQGALCICLE